MEPAAFHFDPSPRDRNSILCSLVAGKDSISLIASRFGIEPADLEAWLARREVISARQAIEAVAAIQSRFAANVNAPLSIGPMVSTLRTIGRQLDNYGDHRETVTHDQVHRNLDAIFKIANRLDKLSRFQPGDHIPLRPRRSRATDTAPDRGTDPALRVRGGPPATSATSPTPAPYQLADPHNPTAPTTDPSHDGAVLGTAVQTREDLNPTLAPVQQQQRPEPHPVSPSIPAAAISLQPPAASPPPAPTSDPLPACETGERWLPDAQRLVAAPSDSPPRQRAGEQWAGEAPPAPATPSSESPPPAAPPPTPDSDPDFEYVLEPVPEWRIRAAQSMERKRQEMLADICTNVYELEDEDFIPIEIPKPRLVRRRRQPPPPPTPPTPTTTAHTARHHNAVEPFS